MGRTVSELMAQNISNAQTNVKTWGGVIYNVKAFGAKGDGITDDTAAIQAALDAAGNNGVVVLPFGDYIVSSITIPTGATLFGFPLADGGSKVRIIGSDLTQSTIKLNTRSCVKGFRLKQNNTDLVSPTVAEPAILLLESNGGQQIENIFFEYCYIGIGSPSTGGNSNPTIRDIRGFVHHRCVFLKGTKDISRIENIHINNPDGVVHDPSYYYYNNRVLIELDDTDGVFISKVYMHSGLSLLKESGGLVVTLNDFGVEDITKGIQITGVANGVGVFLNNGYIQTNNRSDGQYGIYQDSNTKTFINNVSFINSNGATRLFMNNGYVHVNNCRFEGAGTGIQKGIGGTMIVENSFFNALNTAVKLDTGAENLYFGESNVITAGGGTAFSGVTQNALIDVTSPAFVSSNATGQSTIISRYSPKHDIQQFTKGSFLVQQYDGKTTGAGAEIVAAASNNNGGASIGAKVRMKCYLTSATPGSENARLYLQAYSAGNYGKALILYENGDIGLSDGTVKICSGTGSPEGVVTAPKGSLFLRTDGGAGTTLYVKESGTGNTGWVAK